MTQTFILHNNWALGDTVCLSALARDVHRAHPGKYKLLMIGNYSGVFWRNNPHAQEAPNEPTGRLLKLEYRQGIEESNAGSKIHFLSWFHRSFQAKTGIKVPVTEPKGDIHLSLAERVNRPNGRYWVVVAGGKKDMTAKIWSAQYWQQTTDTLSRLGIRCVQAGADFNRHFHPTLTGVEQYVGKTRSERDFFSLIAGAEGVICGITAAMHIAAVFDKPCVVIAGGREPPWWEAYTNCYAPTAFGKECSRVKVEHTFLHTMGLLECNGNLKRGCWKDRTVPLEQADFVMPKNKARLCVKPATVGHQAVPTCLTMITPDHVVEAVMNYYEKGVLPPIGTPAKKYSLPLVHLVHPDQVFTNAQGMADLKAAWGVDPAAPGADKTVVSKITFENGSIISVEGNPPERVRGLDALGPPPVMMSANYPLVDADGKEVGWSKGWDKQLPKQVEARVGEPESFAVLDHPYVGGKFTVFALGFGDNLSLMERCLGSILDTCPKHRLDLRVALNQPSDRLHSYVNGLHVGGAVTKVYAEFGERKKYPAMRRMFHDDTCPIETPYLCWFDDDSWCRKSDWMVLLAQSIIANHPHQGRLYGAWMYHDLASVKRDGALKEKWFKAAPWWKGRNLYAGNGKRLSPNGSQIVFVSGGFLALATHLVKDAGIPDARLNHNGGDITIGCQVTQAGFKVVDFSPRPKEIIAWSDAERRGYREGFPWT